MGLLNPIFITGCARSGTSLVAGIIEKRGAFGGKTAPGNYNNEKGFFENTTIKNDVLKPYLRSLKADPMGQKPLPDMSKVHHVTKKEAEQLREKVISIVIHQGFDVSGDWYY